MSSFLGSVLLAIGVHAGDLLVDNLTVASNLTVQGTISGNGSGLTNVSGSAIVGLNASQITTGQLSVSVLPVSGVWDGSGIVVSNAVFAGDGAALTGLTASQIAGLGSAALNSSTAFASAVQGTLAESAIQAVVPGSQDTNTIIIYGTDYQPNYGSNFVWSAEVGQWRHAVEYFGTYIAWNAASNAYVLADDNGTICYLSTNFPSSWYPNPIPGAGFNSYPTGMFGRSGGGTNFFNGTYYGSFIGNGAGLTNIPGSAIVGTLSASQIAGGQLSVAVLPSGGIWDAGELVLSNAVLVGNGAGLTGLTVTQVSGFGSAATSSASAFLAATNGVIVLSSSVTNIPSGNGLNLGTTAHGTDTNGLPAGNSPRTISVWVRPHQITGSYWPDILLIGFSSSVGGWPSFQIKTAGADWDYIQFDSNHTAGYATGAIDTPNAWYHCVFTLDADGYLHYFVNAVEQEKIGGTDEPMTPDTFLTEGTSVNLWLSSSNWDLSTFAYWNRALSTEEVAQIFTNGVAATPDRNAAPWSSGLVRLYRFAGNLNDDVYGDTLVPDGSPAYIGGVTNITTTSSNVPLAAFIQASHDASQITTGQLSASVLPSSNGVWNAGGLVLTNVTVQGITASQISGLGSAAFQDATNVESRLQNLEVSTANLSNVWNVMVVGRSNITATATTNGQVVTYTLDGLAGGGGGGAATWGNITGQLTDQTDLQAVLTNKLDVAGGAVTGLTYLAGGVDLQGSTISNGVFIGDGAGLTNVQANAIAGGLNASQITAGQLPASVLPSSGIWDAGGMVVTNAVLTGSGAGLTGLTVSQINGLGSAATNNSSEFMHAVSYVPVYTTNNPASDYTTNWFEAYTTNKNYLTIENAYQWGVNGTYHVVDNETQWAFNTDGNGSYITRQNEWRYDGEREYQVTVYTIQGNGAYTACIEPDTEPIGQIWNNNWWPYETASSYWNYDITTNQAYTLATNYPSYSTNWYYITNYDGAGNFYGNFSGTGVGLRNLNANQITVGQLSPAVLPSSGVWDASGLVVTNAVLAGNGANLSGLTVSQINGLGSAATNSSSDFMHAINYVPVYTTNNPASIYDTNWFEVYTTNDVLVVSGCDENTESDLNGRYPFPGGRWACGAYNPSSSPSSQGAPSNGVGGYIVQLGVWFDATYVFIVRDSDPGNNTCAYVAYNPWYNNEPYSFGTSGAYGSPYGVSGNVTASWSYDIITNQAYTIITNYPTYATNWVSITNYDGHGNFYGAFSGAGSGLTNLSASQITSGQLSPSILPSGSGTWDAGGLVITNVVIGAADGNTLSSLTVNGTFSVINTATTNTISGPTIIQYIPPQGDLGMGSFTNQMNQP